MLKLIVLPFIKANVPSWLRTGATFAAGYFVAKGLIDAGTGDALAAALVTIGTIGWSAVERQGLLNKLVG